MGSVVVIGAGIAGIQASLDIADHGIHVHLIEREPSIGGHMAHPIKLSQTTARCASFPLKWQTLRVTR
jgi:heterodisulfide reductase subunit A-like polyferredoxin